MSGESSVQKTRTYYMVFLAKRHRDPSDATGVISPGNSLKIARAIGPRVYRCMSAVRGCRGCSIEVHRSTNTEPLTLLHMLEPLRPSNEDAPSPWRESEGASWAVGILQLLEPTEHTLVPWDDLYEVAEERRSLRTPEVRSGESGHVTVRIGDVEKDDGDKDGSDGKHRRTDVTEGGHVD